MRVGLLLPHFSGECTWDRAVGMAPQIEAYGFDSVWARDNLAFTGHGFELPGNTFVDPFIVLSTIAGRTRDLKLGTAVTIPFRNPVVTAQLVGSLSWVSQGRFELGVGPGTPTKPYELTGIPYPDRIRLCQEMVEVIRTLSSGAAESYAGTLTQFADTLIDPPPPAHLPVWYGGASNASVRRTVRYADGILPGRCPFSRYDVARQRLESEASQAGRPTPMLGSIPLVSIGRSREDALTKISGSVDALLEYLSGHWRSQYSSIDDLGGAVIVGTAADVAEQLQEFQERGFDLVVLDSRLSMDEFEDVTAQLGEEVLPLLDKGSTAGAAMNSGKA